MKSVCGGCGKVVAKGHTCHSRPGTPCVARPRVSRERNTGNRVYRRNRETALERDGHICVYCGDPATEVDHVTPVALGGTHDVDNLVACCETCNRSKGTGALPKRLGATPTRMPTSPLIALVGPIASGKSTLAAAIVERAGWHPISIDRIRRAGGDWPQMLRTVQRVSVPAVAESVALPREYRRTLDVRAALLVYVICNEETRAVRLRARGKEYAPPRYDDRGTADLIVAGDHEVTAEKLDDLVRRARALCPPSGKG